MKTFTLALLTLLLTTQLRAMDNYFHLTNTETSMTFPGDIIRFFGRDSLWGPVHSNDWIASQNVGGLPSVFDQLSTSKPSFRPGSPTPPANFFDGPPIFNASEIVFPESLYYLRTYAQENGVFLLAPGHEWRCEIDGNIATFFHYPEGTAFDPENAQSLNIFLSPRAVVFIDGKLDIKGEVNSNGCHLILGCSQDIRIIDNVMLQGTNMSNGRLNADATSSIAIASEQSIFVANTLENGRQDCGGNHAGHGRCHVVITAFLFALRGTFQIEQMNDIGDPYVCPTPPTTDERGNLVITGGITQFSRGYLHRSNHAGTGYNKVFHYDERLRRWRVGVFEPIDPFEEEVISSSDPEPLFPQEFLLSVSPNPFNASTTIRFTLPNADHVRAIVFDVQGRQIAQLTNQTYAAGNHTLQFNGANLSSGVYFLSFATEQQQSTHKLLLLK